MKMKQGEHATGAECNKLATRSHPSSAKTTPSAITWREDTVAPSWPATTHRTTNHHQSPSLPSINLLSRESKEYPRLP